MCLLHYMYTGTCTLHRYLTTFYIAMVNDNLNEELFIDYYSKTCQVLLYYRVLWLFIIVFS